MGALMTKRQVVILVLSALALAFALACGGGKAAGDKAGAVNQVLQISPATAQLAPGQSLQFTASGTWEGGLTWTVLPTSGGTITAAGLFTASGTPGAVQVLAVWSRDVRYAATAQATILPPPPTSISTPSLVSASGKRQASTTGASTNTSVAGEAVVPITAKDASQYYELRHGFSLLPH
jgi:hypothetical protein